MDGAPLIHKPGHISHVTPSSLLTSRRGIWALKWAFVGLMFTAVLQAILVYYTGSVALLADTIHNFGDALTAVPLWIAFRMSTWKPTARFTYGYGRVEDLAGIVIILVILLSAALAGYESITRLFHPQEVRFLSAVMAASLIGFTGNEAVAQFRIKVGKEINSAALVADGHHARIDGLTSLAVFIGALGVYVGYPLADPIIGLLITVAILRVVWDAGKLVVIRMIDGTDPAIPNEIREGASHVKGVQEVSEVRVRWIGHQLRAEVNIAVNPVFSVEAGHVIATEVRHHLLHHLSYLDDVVIHVDPLTASGEEHHYIRGHDY
ncbi:MAG: cation diffusion facilitator family transporter [Halobacteriota archaeon]